MLTPDLDTVRLGLHLLAAAIWVGGQLVLASLLPVLRTAGPDGQAVAKDLMRLLPMKTKAEYEPDDIPRSDAVKAVDRAHRPVDGGM